MGATAPGTDQPLQGAWPRVLVGKCSLGSLPRAHSQRGKRWHGAQTWRLTHPFNPFCREGNWRLEKVWLTRNKLAAGQTWNSWLPSLRRLVISGLGPLLQVSRVQFSYMCIFHRTKWVVSNYGLVSNLLTRLTPILKRRNYTCTSSRGICTPSSFILELLTILGKLCLFFKLQWGLKSTNSMMGLVNSKSQDNEILNLLNTLHLFLKYSWNDLF